MPGLREGNGKRCGTKYEEFLFYDGTFKIFACTQSGYRCQAVRRGHIAECDLYSLPLQRL